MMNGLGLGLGRSLSSSTGGGGGTSPSGPVADNFSVASRSEYSLFTSWNGTLTGTDVWRVQAASNADPDWSGVFFDVTTNTNDQEVNLLTPNVAYKLRIRAVDEFGVNLPGSSWVEINDEYTIPEIPQSVGANGFSEGYIQVSWSTQSNISYRIYRNGSQIQEVTDASFNDFGVAQGENYSYEVEAVSTLSGLTSNGKGGPAVGSWNP